MVVKFMLPLDLTMLSMVSSPIDLPLYLFVSLVFPRFPCRFCLFHVSYIFSFNRLFFYADDRSQELRPKRMNGLVKFLIVS